MKRKKSYRIEVTTFTTHPYTVTQHDYWPEGLWVRLDETTTMFFPWHAVNRVKVIRD